MSAQYLFRQQVQALHMKDSTDATSYVAQHAVFHEHLIDVGVPQGKTNALYHMLMGLPQTPIWQQFKSLLEQHMHDKSMSITVTSVPTFTFESCVLCIMSEAAHHIVTQHVHSSHPGSKYVNVATASTASGTMWGGGMEGQVPWMHNKKKDSTEKKGTAIAVAATPIVPATAPVASVIAAVATDLQSLMQDLSFTLITELLDEIACTTTLLFTTILNSGTTVTLVKDCCFFHTYSTEDPVNVLIANHY
ncbi:hypothetical protein EDB19DRAFT_1904833 [Suillus lakei]|nr:hypothetical protein EDB19DRAFT_1904833 [Suillus lakei]